MPKSVRLLAALLSGALIVAACGSTPPTSPTTGNASPSIAPPGGGPAATNAPPPEPGDPTSETLIATALAAGTITLEQSLLYRALALFGSAELPEAYRSPVHEMHAAVELFGEIDANEAALSPAVLEKLAPYRVRPADPISIFNGPGATGSRGIVLAVQAGPTWKSLPAPGSGARVWVKDSPNADAQLATYAAAVAKVWNQMPGIFTYPEPDKVSDPVDARNPDSATDFYFVDVGGLDPRRSYCVRFPNEPNCRFSPVDNGIAMRTDFHGHQSSGYLLIDAAVQGDQLLDTIAHELTHAAQFAYDVNDASWLMESTATWAAYRVMKKLDLRPAYAYGFLEDFFAGLDQSLTRLDNHNHYGAWLYFLFASMEEGDGIVTTIWQEAAPKGEDGAVAVDKAFAWDEHFDDFSVRNWNKDPVERQYKSAPDNTFPTNREPNLTRDTAIAGAEENLLDAEVAQLASVYYRYEFDSGVRNVIVENAYAGVEEAHLWAIKKVFGVWQKPEDWTNEVKKEFCRDIEEQDVSELILVVSNASMRQVLIPPEPAKVVTKTLGCPGWSGTMTSTRTWDQLDGGVPHTGTTTATFTGLWKADGPDATSIFPCSQAYPPAEPCIVYRPIGTITWTWQAEYPADAYQPGCKANTSGSLDAGNTLHPDVQSLVLQPIENNKVKYRGLGAFVIGETQKCPDVISGGGNPSQFFDILENARSDAPADDTGDTCFHTTWVIDASADTIAGSCSSYVYSYHTLRFEWNLKRVGKAIPTP